MATSGTLRIRHSHEAGDGEIFVEAANDGFAGRARAWVSRVELTAFARDLEVYPLSAERPPRITAGYWSRDSVEPTLEEELLFVEVRPANRKGALLVEVRLTDSVLGEGSTEWKQHVRLSFLTDYTALAKFTDGISRIITEPDFSVELSGCGS